MFAFFLLPAELRRDDSLRQAGLPRRPLGRAVRPAAAARQLPHVRDLELAA